jgi:hypothetical protein
LVTDWDLVWFQAAQSVLVLVCTAGLGYFLNRSSARRMERLKADLATQQVVRNEKKDIYFQVLGILGRMGYEVGAIRSSLDSGSVGPPLTNLDTLRGELYQVAPCAIMMLKDKAALALDAYRRKGEPALKLNLGRRERWDQEEEAIADALKVLISAGQQDLGL